MEITVVEIRIERVLVMDGIKTMSKTLEYEIVEIYDLKKVLRFILVILTKGLKNKYSFLKPEE